ncbi:class I SAM-dependent methyltransferase [Kribbella shirazensis]|uniref:SAM-dependent methyltransferase n=1 Tax=Kribbella shirazensis TaxID=1105143 RepID=A0A7X6A4D5_9ACTN|nr:rRNA adenine N-6-methyltransferase family protein [Kribbella shirazensis]NIK60890.1 SAM-dependent methyltransferase [Kribbella shirazensis]
MSREKLRTTFGEDAELYDRVRPGYPRELFDEVARVVGERPKVLEVGPGTGQATAPMVERGWDVTAVELSPGLAEVLRRKFPAVGEIRVRRVPEIRVGAGVFARRVPRTSVLVLGSSGLDNRAA